MILITVTVHVKTVLVPIPSLNQQHLRSPQHYHQVILDGTADAVLSRGLLAILSAVISGGSPDSTWRKTSSSTTLTAHDVLSMDPDTITDYLGLREVLSVGRNDGLASIIRVVQHQISNLLQEVSQHEQTNGNETISVGNEDENNDDHDHSKITVSSDSVLQEATFDDSAVTTATSVDVDNKPAVAMLLSGGVDSFLDSS